MLLWYKSATGQYYDKISLIFIEILCFNLSIKLNNRSLDSRNNLNSFSISAPNFGNISVRFNSDSTFYNMIN